MDGQTGRDERAHGEVVDKGHRGDGTRRTATSRHLHQRSAEEPEREGDRQVVNM